MAPYGRPKAKKPCGDQHDRKFRVEGVQEGQEPANPVQISKYRRHNFRLGRRKQTVLFPSTEYQQKVSLGRQFLHFNHVFAHRWLTKRTIGERLSMKEWYKELKRRKHLNVGLAKHVRCNINRRAKRPPSKILQSMQDFGFDKWSRTSAQFDLFKQECDNRASAAGQQTSDAIDASNNSNAEQPIGLLASINEPSSPNEEDQQTQTSISVSESNTPLKEHQIGIPERVKDPDVPEEQYNEKWQREHWKAALVWENLTKEVNEIVCNRRFFKSAKMAPRHLLLLLESLHRSIFIHDWTLSAKCLELVMDEFVRGTSLAPGIKRSVLRRWPWTTWNAGFLSLLRHANGNKETIKDFTRSYCSLHTQAFFNFYPRRCAIEVCIWLTQEGYFRDAITFLEEIEEIKAKRIMYKIFQQMENPKRDLIDLIANLMKAVFLYALWRKEIDLVEAGDPSGDEVKARRSGETATSAFEALLEVAKDCKAEITALLDPLTELVMEYRSPTRAREILRDLVVQHYGNAFVEDAYLQFVEEYFPQDVDEEFIKELRLGKKFDFNGPPSWGQGGDTNQSRIVAVYRERKRKEMQEKKYFKQLPQPAFSL